MKTIAAMLVILASGGFGRVGMEMLFAQAGAAESAMLELVKQSPLAASGVVVVWLFLKHLRDARQQMDIMFERSHEVHDRATEATMKQVASMAELKGAVDQLKERLA